MHLLGLIAHHPTYISDVRLKGLRVSLRLLLELLNRNNFSNFFFSVGRSCSADSALADG